jgi:hypothetical protein
LSEHKPSKTEMPETKLRSNCGVALMERIATRARAKSRKRSKDPKMDWVCLLVSYRPLAQANRRSHFKPLRIEDGPAVPPRKPFQL